MNLIRFNPFAEVTSLRDQVNRLFDEASLPRGEREGSAGARVWGPAVDIAEGENEVTVFIEHTHLEGGGSVGILAAGHRAPIEARAV